MPLEKELETYRSQLEQLRQHEGRFVLIHGAEVAGVFDTYEDAINEGYERFELTPFLVKRVQAFEQAQFASRFVSPTPA